MWICLCLFALMSYAVSLPINSTQQIEYHSQYRPQLHLSVPYGWMNDPNGFVKINGNYHLFYQYNPNDTKWGPMHWGHAVSKDLIHWKNLPIAIKPGHLGTIYSGSAILDYQNVTGLKKSDDKLPLVAMYTLDDNSYETQALAYSYDEGLTFTQYEHNPVITNPNIRDFRDPSVFRYGDHFIMVLAAGDHAQIFRSSNMIQWQLLSVFGIGPEQGERGGIWECPSLFPLPVINDEGNKVDTKWVMMVSLNLDSDLQKRGSVTQYFVGDFNGTHFINANEPTRIMWNDFGPDNYAAIPMNENTENDVILIGWMDNWLYGAFTPDEGYWRGQMTIPRYAQLRLVNDDVYMAQLPYPQIFKQRNYENSYVLPTVHDFARQPELSLDSVGLSGNLYNIELVLQLIGQPSNGQVELRFMNTIGEHIGMGINLTSNAIFFDRRNAGQVVNEHFLRNTSVKRIATSNEVSFSIILDTIAVEMFVDHGLNIFSGLYYPNQPFSKLTLKASGLNLTEGQQVIATSLKVYPMKSIWD